MKRERPSRLPFTTAQEMEIQKIVTDRLLAFYEGLRERNQIASPIPVIHEVRSVAGDEHSSAGHATESGHVLPFSVSPHREKRHD